MVENKHSIRIRYSESDQMRFVHHSNYVKFFEIGRIELMRQIGINYQKLEQSGLGLPVLKIEINYIKPVFFDDEIFIKTRLIEKPSGPRISFYYEIFNDKNQKVTEGKSDLAFMNLKTGKPVRCPEDLIHAVAPYFD